MSAAEVRVVLVKPGDVLLIGNIDPERVMPSTQVSRVVDAFETLRQTLGLDVLAFAGDIDIDVWERAPRPPVAPLDLVGQPRRVAPPNPGVPSKHGAPRPGATS